MDAAHPMQASHTQQLHMLQIALAPAPVARGEFDEIGWRLLVGAAEAGQHVDGPAGAPNEGRFDEIMAHDMAAERLASLELRQASTFGEGAHANDGVVSPVITVAPMPGGKPVGDDRSIDPPGKLL